MAKKNTNEPYIEPVMTHNVLIDTMEKIGFGNSSNCTGMKILVINNYDVALQYAMENEVTYITADKECYDKFNFFTSSDFGDDDNCILVEEDNWLDAIKKVLDMKFDVAIMNPPYDRNLHLKILEKVIPIANKVVNISPVRWLQDPFAKYLKTSDYKKFEESISKKIETLDIIPAEEATKKFDNAAFTMNLGIYVCGNGGYQYDNETPLIKKIIKKTMENSWEPFNFAKNKKPVDKTYIINIAGIHSKEAKYPFVCNTYNQQLKTQTPKDFKGGRNGAHFSFDTEVERLNFYLCYTHRFMSWHASLWKFDVNMNTFKIPYFGDYTKPWTTKMFCDYFDITGYIDDEHAIPGSEWEEIMKQW